jgi:nucleosome binding factor SPN SPT16 subunit
VKKRIGGLPKEPQAGRIVEDWSKALEEHAGKPEIADISAGLASIMAVKDEEELVSEPWDSACLEH